MCTTTENRHGNLRLKTSEDLPSGQTKEGRPATLLWTGFTLIKLKYHPCITVRRETGWKGKDMVYFLGRFARILLGSSGRSLPLLMALSFRSMSSPCWLWLELKFFPLLLFFLLFFPSNLSALVFSSVLLWIRGRRRTPNKIGKLGLRLQMVFITTEEETWNWSQTRSLPRGKTWKITTWSSVELLTQTVLPLLFNPLSPVCIYRLPFHHLRSDKTPTINNNKKSSLPKNASKSQLERTVTPEPVALFLFFSFLLFSLFEQKIETLRNQNKKQQTTTNNL